MTELQILTLVATLLGVTVTVLNIVAFVREKDKSHTRTGFMWLFLLAAVLAIFLLPRYAPGPAARMVSFLPPSAGQVLQPWLRTPTAAPDIANPPSVAAPAMRASFTIKVKRNMLGGIGALKSNFQFFNSSEETIQVTGYHLRIIRKQGEAERSYDRVLSEPFLITADSKAELEVELDAEIRDQWHSREKLKAEERGVMEMSWDCESAGGKHFQLTSSNG